MPGITAIQRGITAQAIDIAGSSYPDDVNAHITCVSD